MDTMLFSEENEVVAKIDPASYNSAQNTGYILANKHSRYVFIMQIGLIASTGTLDFKLQQSQDGSGTGLKDISGKAITQMIDTADNKVRIIELRTDELDITNGFVYIRGLVTPATAASLLSVVVLGINPRQKPVAIHADLAVVN